MQRNADRAGRFSIFDFQFSTGRALVGLTAACGLLLAGCGPSHARVSGAPLSAPAERELEARAMNLLLTAAESDLDDISCNAIESLVRVAPRDGLPAFRKAIQSKSPIVRFAGYAALGDVRDGGSKPALEAGLKDESPLVRLAAAYALCRLAADAPQAALLVHTLTDTQQENLRAAAAELLGRLGEGRATRVLDAALRYPVNQRSVRVSLALYGALAALGNGPAVGELINQSQGAPEARSIALLLLADLGKAEATEALRYQLNRPKKDYDEELRLIAVRGLGRVGSAEGFDYALEMAQWKDPNPKPTIDNPDRTFPVRSLAVHALAEIRDVRALPVLRELASSQEPRLQVAAAYAICRIMRH